MIGTSFTNFEPFAIIETAEARIISATAKIKVSRIGSAIGRITLSSTATAIAE
jgi:hypothetical protein